MRKLAIKTRSNKTETEHFGYLALCNSQAKPDKRLNDTNQFFVRSCIKPIQAKVCKDILGEELSDEFLVMSIASHLSSKEQISILNKMLDRFQLKEDSLYCGTKSSTNNEAFKSKLNHNCAGKHIAHLAAAQKAQLNNDYYSFNHELQKRLYQELLDLTNKNHIETGIDGCGLPTFYMGLMELAACFTRASQKKAYKNIFKTVNKYSNLISGVGRFDQELMQQFPDKFLAKSGADGMMLITNLKSFETLVIKILDGEKRVKDIVAQKVLEELDWIKTGKLNLDNQVYNSLGQVVGEVNGLDCL
jgi:L-asparaginase II